MEYGNNSVSYSIIVDYFGEQTIKDRYSYLYEKMRVYIEERGLEDVLEINKSLLEQTLLDYFTDVYRLKKFHGIKHINITKIVSYEVFWLLRRKPIQVIKSEDNPKLRFVNEGFLTAFLAHECLIPNDVAPMSDEQQNDFLNYIKHINYCLKYRAIDKQWLETMLYSLEIGKLISK